MTQVTKPERRLAASKRGNGGRWLDGKLPANVRLGTDTIVRGDHAFHRFRSNQKPALIIGRHCTMDGVHFALGEGARVEIGDFCCFSNSLLLCELEIRIGNYVVMGWNATIADSDFHPISPAQRIADAIACSPLGKGHARPPIAIKPVVIEDDVWIGPNATLLKGVRIGADSFIEPGALVTRDVPPHSRIMGNPAQVIGTV
jgi:acetyltransferase-like isoleucine patch superfamily enzyme